MLRIMLLVEISSCTLVYRRCSGLYVNGVIDNTLNQFMHPGQLMVRCGLHANSDMLDVLIAAESGSFRSVLGCVACV
jgi:hypothetical protein